MPFTATTIRVRAGSTAAALDRLERWLQAAGLAGDMRGCLYSEIGALGRIMLIHDYPAGGMFEDRDKMIDAPSAFGLGELFRSATIETYAAFDKAPLLPAGHYGPYYEVREYMLTGNGLEATKRRWAETLDARKEWSVPLVAATASTGTMHRLLSIWPYPSLAERGRIRADSVAAGAWSPTGGIDFIRKLSSEIFLPAGFSQLQ